MSVITDDILTITKMTAGQLKVELAAFLYSKNQISFGQACRLAALDVLAFQAVLFDNHIPLHYGISDLEDDIKAIQTYTTE